MAKKIDADQPRFTRSEVARKSGYSPTRLLDLERAGVVKPTRLGNGFRLYSENDVSRLLKRREQWDKKQVYAVDG